MDILKIETGEKRISINGDESRVITFNPSDTLFAERFYLLMNEFEHKLNEYQTRSIELEADNRTNGNELPANMGERLELVKEACTYSRESIDKVFGEGTSQAVFGDALSLDLIQQFFEGITPLIQVARVNRIQKYIDKKPKKKVMK